jgi:hypothetical protein
MKRMLNSMLFSVVALSLCLGASRSVYAASTPETNAEGQKTGSKVAISSQVDRTEITIGDQVHYTVTVRFPLGGRIDLPSVLGNLGSFEVKEYLNGTPKEKNGEQTQTWSFTLSTFTVGDYIIPPQLVEFFKGQDTTAQVFMTQPIAIKVKRTSPETVKDIADISPPEEPAVRRPWWLVLAGVLLAAAAYLGWRLRRRPVTLSQLDQPALPPYEEAMEALLALNASVLVRQNRSRELSFALSHLLRRYLSRRYAVDALESTSSEFITLAAQLPLALPQKPFIPRFCEITDPVKFASVVWLESEATQLTDDLRRFLEATRPRPEPEVKT